MLPIPAAFTCGLRKKDCRYSVAVRNQAVSSSLVSSIVVVDQNHIGHAMLIISEGIWSGDKSEGVGVGVALGEVCRRKSRDVAAQLG